MRETYQNRAVDLQQLIMLLPPNQAITYSSNIEKKPVIYGLVENIQDVQFVQTERDRNSLLQMFKDKMELKETTVKECFRLG